MFRRAELYLVRVYNGLRLLGMLFCWLSELFDVYNDVTGSDEDDKDKFEAKKFP